MNLNLDEPIVALASPPGSAARSIIRISGENVREVLQSWFIPANPQGWSENRFAARHEGLIRLSECRADIGVHVLLWPNNKSYTGQQLIELHLPGSPPLVDATLLQINRSGVRPARPGEFTLRAFLSGKIDLLQAEAVLGVIDANEGEELKSALDQLAGGISKPLMTLRENILELLTDIEAGLDFIEEDIEFVSKDELRTRISSAHQFIKNVVEQATTRSQSRTRPRIVLAGLPNAGKSTLFNRLVMKSRSSGEAVSTTTPVALMSPIEGTTRDYLCAHICWHGIEFELVDTAGWDLDAIEIEKAAQHQLADQIQRANLLLWCYSAAMSKEKQRLDEDIFNQASRSYRNVIRIQTHSDLLPIPLSNAAEPGSAFQQPAAIFSVSAVTGDGVDKLIRVVVDHFLASQSCQSHWLGTTVARCQESLVDARDALCRTEISAIENQVGDELLAIDLREALDHLGQVIGAVYSEDILDRVFSKFCIGK